VRSGIDLEVFGHRESGRGRGFRSRWRRANDEIAHDTASSRGQLGLQQDADGVEVLADRHERTRRREGEHAQQVEGNLHAEFEHSQAAARGHGFRRNADDGRAASRRTLAAPLELGSSSQN
jgi:hypothetical protein